MISHEDQDSNRQEIDPCVSNAAHFSAPVPDSRTMEGIAMSFFFGLGLLRNSPAVLQSIRRKTEDRGRKTEDRRCCSLTSVLCLLCSVLALSTGLQSVHAESLTIQTLAGGTRGNGDADGTAALARYYFPLGL